MEQASSHARQAVHRSGWITRTFAIATSLLLAFAGLPLASLRGTAVAAREPNGFEKRRGYSTGAIGYSRSACGTGGTTGLHGDDPFGDVVERGKPPRGRGGLGATICFRAKLLPRWHLSDAVERQAVSTPADSRMSRGFPRAETITPARINGIATYFFDSHPGG